MLMMGPSFVGYSIEEKLKKSKFRHIKINNIAVI